MNASTRVFSQNLTYTNYNTSNGLPSNQIYNIFQDENGYIWIASDRGIARYDGYEFESFDQSDGLTGNTVFWFHPQSNGDVLCSTYRNQWFYFNQGDYQFKAYPLNDQLKKYAEFGINDDHYTDKEGNQYYSFIHWHGVLSINSKGEIVSEGDLEFEESDTIFLIQEYAAGEDFHYTAEIRNEQNIIENSKKVILPIIKPDVHYFKMTRVGETFIFSNNQNLYLLDQNSEIIKEHQLPSDILGVGKYDEEHFWVGTKLGGVFIFDLKGNQKDHFLENKSVSFAYRDHQNGVWFATLSSGIFYVKSSYINHYEFDGGNIKWLTESVSGEFFVSTLYYKVFEKKGRDFYEFLDGGEMGLGIVLYNELLDGDVYFSGEGIRTKEKEFISELYVSSISKDISKPLLFASPYSLYYVLNDSLHSASSPKRINAISWAEKGIYVGTNEGLVLYDTLSHEFSTLFQEELTARVQHIETKNKITFIATLGNGLVILQDSKLWSLGKEEGLSSNLINQIEVENDSVVWLATNHGVNRVCLENHTLKVDVLDHTDGLVDNHINDLLVSDDTLWIASGSGLCSFPKSALDKEKVYDFYMNWHSPFVNNELADHERLLDLNYSQNNISIPFHAVEFTNTSSLEYRYRLNELEEDWNYTFQRIIHYPSIPPGDYSLVLQASLNDKNWVKNQLSLSISIAPPFYTRSWFKLLVALFILGIIYLFFRLRVLVYNREIIRELLRYFLRRIKPQSNHFVIKEQGKDVRLNSDDILFIHSLGNYIEINTTDQKYVIRHKLKDFKKLVPDKLEYIQVNRSYIVRIDKIQSKNTKELIVNGIPIPIGRTYQASISKIEL